MASVNQPSQKPDSSPADDRHAESPSQLRPEEVDRLLSIQVPVIVVLAEKTMALREVLDLAVGSVIQFEKPVDAPLDLRVNNQPIAAGHAVRSDENFGLQIIRMGPVGDTIRKLGRNPEPGQSPSQESDPS